MFESSIKFRVQFKPEHAAQFLTDKQLEKGQLVVESLDYTLEEAADFVREFYSSLDEALILVDDKKVIAMSDFLESGA